jgi:hypothetical protein
MDSESKVYNFSLAIAIAVLGAILLILWDYYTDPDITHTPIQQYLRERIRSRKSIVEATSFDKARIGAVSGAVYGAAVHGIPGAITMALASGLVAGLTPLYS